MSARALLRHYFPAFTRDTACFHLKDADKGTFLVRKSSGVDGSLVVSLNQVSSLCELQQSVYAQLPLQGSKILHLLVIKRAGGWSLDPSAWKNHELGKLVFTSLELLVAKLKELKMIAIGLTQQGARCSCALYCLHFFIVLKFSARLCLQMLTCDWANKARPS